MLLIETAREQRYESTEGIVLQREWGLTPNGNPMDGRWVLRDAKGNMLDFNQYRHDIAEKHGFTLRGKED